MTETGEKHRLARLRRKYTTQYDAVAMLFYMVLVYGWGLFIYPLGRDYAMLAGTDTEAPFLTSRVVGCERAFFGTHVPAYHVFNLILLYGCMQLVYWLVHRVVSGPRWLGVLAASLFMANPVHSEAVLNLSGPADLLPCLFALGALLAYVAYVADPTVPVAFLALGLFALAVLPFRSSVALIAVYALYSVLEHGQKKARLLRFLPFLVVAAISAIVHGSALLEEGFDPVRAFGPLYFVFYPLGFLPETARRFHLYPWLGWISGAAAVGVVVLVCRGVRRRAVALSFAAAAAVRLSQSGRSVDPVHLVGGGQLLLANALYCLALVGVFRRMMDHPKWPRMVIGGTTLLCLAFFLLEFRSVCAWRHAGAYVRAFQERAAETVGGRAGPLGIAPDYRYYRGAPMCLSESIAYDTPFSNALPSVSLLPLHYDRPGRMAVHLVRWEPKLGIVSVKGKSPLEVAPWLYTLAESEAAYETSHDSFEIAVRPKTGLLPSAVLPADTLGSE